LVNFVVVTYHLVVFLLHHVISEVLRLDVDWKLFKLAPVHFSQTYKQFVVDFVSFVLKKRERMLFILV